MEFEVTVTDNLRRQPNGLKLGLLKAGAKVECSNLQKDGWREVTASLYGHGWFRAAYLEATTPEEDPQPVDVDPITSLTLTAYHESGAVETLIFVPV